MAADVFDATGEGVWTLAASRSCFAIDAELIVPGGRVQFTSETDPRRVMHAGWYAIGEFWGATTHGVTWWRFMEHERETTFFDTPKGVHTVIYRVEPGCTIEITVNY